MIPSQFHTYCNMGTGHGLAITSVNSLCELKQNATLLWRQKESSSITKVSVTLSEFQQNTTIH